MFDGWYTSSDEEKSAYYQESYAEQLQNSMLASPDDPFNEHYYSAMYASSEESWVESDANFALPLRVTKGATNCSWSCSSWLSV